MTHTQCIGEIAVALLRTREADALLDFTKTLIALRQPITAEELSELKLSAVKSAVTIAQAIEAISAFVQTVESEPKDIQ